MTAWLDPVNGASWRAEFRAGIMPAPDQAEDCLLSQPMNVLAAFALFLSLAAWAVMKNWWESDQAPGPSPIVGIGAIPKLVPAALRSLICQMPSQVMEF